MNSVTGRQSAESAANTRYVTDHPIVSMSRPPTVDHTMPPTPVKAMQMPSIKPARLANQRLSQYDDNQKQQRKHYFSPLNILRCNDGT